ncbi:hypothetical protein [Brevundimonas sp.]|uniref:hypothetical protein n=1 Tax=Brevundimonas sp. TaxID=1871086 RepID=UPI003D0BC173
MTHVSPSLLLLIATLSVAAPARAQDAAAPATPAEAATTAEPTAPAEPAAEAVEETVSPEEAAFNQRAAALGQRVLAVDTQMKDAARLAALDPDAAKAELDALQAGFQAEMDAFIQDFFSFAAQKLVTLPEDEQAVLRTNVENRAGELVALPQAMRSRAEAAALLPPPTQIAPSSN